MAGFHRRAQLGSRGSSMGRPQAAALQFPVPQLCFIGSAACSSTALSPSIERHRGTSDPFCHIKLAGKCGIHSTSAQEGEGVTEK